jgi:O-antigen ligase
MLAIPAVILMRWVLRRPTAIGLCAAILPIVPPVIVAFSSILLPVIHQLSSARAGSYGMFSGRELVWGGVVATWLTHMDLGDRILGVGYYGQAISGASDTYSFIFAAFADSETELASVHNSYLQMALDVGVIGLMAAMSFLGVLSARLLRLPAAREIGIATLLLLLALGIMGGTEVILTPYCREGAELLCVAYVMVALAEGTQESPNASRSRVGQDRAIVLQR